MKAKVLIVEDELLIAENHKDNLISFGFTNVKIAYSAQEAFILLDTFQPDLILLDVRLNVKTEGIDFAKALNQTKKIPIIYLTAHSDQAILDEILQTKPAAFLSKPVRKSELFSAVNIALARFDHHMQNDGVVIEEGGTKIYFLKSDFLYGQSNGNYIQLYFKNQTKQLIRMTMDALQKTLNDPNFFRINRSQIVNLDQIQKVKNKNIWIDDISFSVSPNYLVEFTSQLDKITVRY